MATKKEIPEVKIIEINSEDDLNKFTKKQLVGACLELLDTVKVVTNKANTVNLDNAITSSIKVKQEVMRIQHDLERQRIFTLMDIVGNSKLLLESQTDGNIFKESKKFDIKDHVFNTTNELIDNCLSQINNWVSKNNINTINLKDYEKITKNDNIINITNS